MLSDIWASLMKWYINTEKKSATFDFLIDLDNCLLGSTSLFRSGPNNIHQESKHKIRIFTTWNPGRKGDCELLI